MKHFTVLLMIIIITCFIGITNSQSEADFACLEVWDPVCGVDGQTYPNACYADAAGVDVEYDGECWVGECGECLSDGECPYGTRCNANDICMVACSCPMCAVCAGQCVPLPPVLAAGTRDLPDYGAPDGIIKSCLKINVGDDNVPSGLIINETIPAGWDVWTCTSPYDSFDESSGKISWLFYGGDVKDRNLCCDIRIPEDETDGAVRHFSGELIYNNSIGDPVTVLILGDNHITVKDLPQSCDENQNWKIDDFEILDFIDMWAVGSYCFDPATEKYKAGEHDGTGECM